MTKARNPGACMPQRQPYCAATAPASVGMRKPPMLAEAFQLDHHVPRVAEGNQATNILPQGLPPQPWKKPLATQKTVNHGMELPMENAMFIKPVTTMPIPKMSTGEPKRSDRSPAMNFEFM